MESPSVHRSAASPSSQMSRSSIHPSFSPIRIAASSSSSATLGASSSSGTAPPIPTGSAMTMEAAMASHLGMPNPVHSALETILSERNQLSSQNAQLWKLIEKQRSAYSRMLKDLERIRNERDSYKARLQTSAPPDIKSLKGSVSSSHMHSHSYEKERPSMESQASGSSHSNLNPRMGIVRHQSDDPVTPRKTSLSYESHSESNPVTPSRPHESRGKERERSNNQQPVATSSGTSTTNTSGRSTPSSSYQSQPTLHHPRTMPHNVPLTNGTNAANSLPPTLIIPPRAQSLPSSTSPTAAGHHSGMRPLHLGSKDSATSPSGSVTGASNYFGAPPDAARVVPTPIPPPPQVNLAPQSTPSFTPNAVPNAATLTGKSTLALPNASTASHMPLSRESRISLPDEAKRYIANMGDSPLPSPRMAGSADTTPDPDSKDSGERDRGLDVVAEEVNGKYGRAESPRPFLELEDDESDGEMPAREGAGGLHAAESDLEGEDTEETAVNLDYGSRGGEAHVQKVRKAAATADQFPLPPATRDPLSPTSANVPSLPSQSASSPVYSSNNPFATNTTHDNNPSSTTKRDRKPRDSYVTLREDPPAMTFRSLPLLAKDLEKAEVNVIGSNIRANDKGKERLSFVITVHVVGKPELKLEKYHSDVILFDSKLRAMCNRSTLKKIAPLPDTKLFKDNAPAKVDQRKQILQAYLQSVIQLPLKDKNEIIAFFCSDVRKQENDPVAPEGRKQGYLTKRGKNFGGWKTRYFSLEGPALEYYESPGGTQLGSIVITGAQIGRQQSSSSGGRDLDDENEYRHAFLIIEAKKGSTGQAPRHVLCAENDVERDAWVEVLVRYVVGSSGDGSIAPGSEANNPFPGPYQNGSGQPQMSSSSLVQNDAGRRQAVKGMSKDDITKTSMTPIPISKLSLDASNAKFFKSAPLPDELTASSPAKSSLGPSPIDRYPPGSTPPFSDSQTARKMLERGQESSPEPMSSSLPTSSPLDLAGRLSSVGQRANSEMGHYPDLQEYSAGRGSSEQRRQRTRASYHPTLGTVQSSPITDRPASPETTSPATATNSKVKISGPINGTLIPAGYKFGAKDPSLEPPASNDRERKAKSRTFWGFGRQSNEKSSTTATGHPRNVFGVSIQEALNVAQIANLPAIAFRCIQYLEAKEADQEEGIYRLSGSSAVIKSLKDRFNAEGDIDLLASDEFWDPHAIAGLLKSYLRELPTSILTRENHMRYLGVIDFVDAEERVKELSELVSLLPIENYSLLRALTAHLILIVQNSNVNKMTVRNVGIVFSPTLGIPAGVFSLMLGEFNRVFNVDGEGSDSAAEEEGVIASPKRLSGLSRRNSRRYSEAAADQLLGLSGRSLPTTEEGQSDDGEELSVHDDSEAETTEAETETTTHTVESVAADDARATSPGPGAYEQSLQPPTSSAETTPQTSRASHVAASRGLNIAVGAAERRRSRMPAGGLPVSPRPFNRSPLNTPTSGSPANPSPHTPR